MGEYQGVSVAAAVFAGFIADYIFGDPVYFFHPVRMMGFVISSGERLLRHFIRGKMTAFIFGAVLSVFLIAVSFCLSFVLLSFLYGIHFALGFVVEIVFCYQILSAKALKDESMKVYHQLETGDIQQARHFLSRIVGRDTHHLNEEEVAKAAVETISENLSDGVIAPIFYMMIGGAPLGFAYKAANTLDSMIGYHNEKYEFFGKFAARIDDIVNFIPARLSALLMLASAPFCKLNFKHAVTIFLRDRYKHKSPNSAQTESVCAGALCIALAGDSYYSGVLVQKPVIGDSLRLVEKEDIKRANKMMYGAAWLGLFIGVLIRVAIYCL